MKPQKAFAVLILAPLLAIVSCTGSGDRGQARKAKLYRASIAKKKERISLGDTLWIKLSPRKGVAETPISERLVSMGEQKLAHTLDQAGNIGVSTAEFPVGRLTLKVHLKMPEDHEEQHKVNATVYSNIKPQRIGYRVLNTYDHDKEAYTQGLLFKEGKLFESTGQYGLSSLREVNLLTGEVERRHDIPKNHFGEGLALVDSTLVQLTWRSKVGFIYDLRSFELLRTFSYPMEGWGLVYNDKELLMSNGSETIFSLDPKTFKILKRQDVYTDRGPLTNLNELELVDGLLYANVYQTNSIAVIEYETGRVMAIIDLSNILPKSDFHANLDVLNGIAYDEEGKRLFVTGKNWPKLFEIELDKALEMP